MLAIGGLGFVCGVWRLVCNEPVPTNLGFSWKVLRNISGYGALNPILAVMLLLLAGTSLIVGFIMVYDSFRHDKAQLLDGNIYQPQKSAIYSIFIKDSGAVDHLVIKVTSQNRTVQVTPIKGQYIHRTREGRFRCVGEFKAVQGLAYSFVLPEGISQSEVLVINESIGFLICGILSSIMVASVCFFAAASLLRKTA